MEKRTESKIVWSRKRKDVQSKPCKFCGKTIPRRINKDGTREASTAYYKRIYCSIACANHGRQTKQEISERVCKYKKCKKPLIRKYYDGKIESITIFNERNYCDGVCYHKDRRKFQIEKAWSKCWHCRNHLIRREKEKLSDWRERKFCDYIECFKMYKFDHEGHLKPALKRFPCTHCDMDKSKIRHENVIW